MYELYSVPLDGSNNPVKLNAPLVGDTYISWLFLISPDSSRVIYTDKGFELYSVPLAGGSVVKLNPSGGSVSWWVQISPDSSRVVYTADQDTDEVYELYSVPLAGGNVVKLNPPLVVGGGIIRWLPFVMPFQISPDSSRVVYVADQETDEVYELYASFEGEVGTVFLPIIIRSD